MSLVLVTNLHFPKIPDCYNPSSISRNQSVRTLSTTKICDLTVRDIDLGAVFLSPHIKYHHLSILICDRNAIVVTYLFTTENISK